MSLELRFLARFPWREAYVLHNWQLAELPQSGGVEFDPLRVHDNLWVPLLVNMHFPVPEHQINPKNMYIASARAQFKIHTQVLKLTPGYSRRVVSF